MLMFGNILTISNGKLSLKLRPAHERDIPAIAERISDWEVKKYLGRVGGVIEKNERDWVEKVSNTQDSMIWFIEGEDSDIAIGSTGVHNIDGFNGTCTSGIVIWNKESWGNGIASLAHIARTWFVGKQMGIKTIQSEVFALNEASYKALLKVGYFVVGVNPRIKYVDGRYIDKYNLGWLNPIFIDILYPDKIPDKYIKPLEIAKETLEKGDKWIS